MLSPLNPLLLHLYIRINALYFLLKSLYALYLSLFYIPISALTFTLILHISPSHILLIHIHTLLPSTSLRHQHK